MYVRVVRFIDAASERIEQLTTRIGQAERPPEGVPSLGVQVLFDKAQRTAIALRFFETAEDMRQGDEGMSAIESSETPGTRASVDMCELKIERRPPSREGAGAA